ncbi:MAG: carbamate kinase [Methanomicrobiaceae archaeon]|nr:carbamate kinase [Methanomicrobiaceae archaeon]
MRIVVALGGNAILRRKEPLSVENQRRNIRVAAKSLAPLAERHELILSHGNGPQVGLLALQSSCYNEKEAYPLDVLGAESEGMIGYMIEQELGNLLPPETPIATILTMVEVSPDDPAFKNPSKFIGPVYSDKEAERISKEKGWTFKKDGSYLRRVVPSPKPLRIFEIRPVKWLIEKGTVVICTGGGGIPTVFEDSAEKTLKGTEAVIDKDLAAGLLAVQTGADLFVMATDVKGVYQNYGENNAGLISRTTPEELKNHVFPEGSMGPKIEAACRFVEITKKRCAIGSLEDIEAIVNGTAGTSIIAGD